MITLRHRIDDGNDEVDDHDEDDLLQHPTEDAPSSRRCRSAGSIRRSFVQFGLLRLEELLDGLLQLDAEARQPADQIDRRLNRLLSEEHDHEDLLNVHLDDRYERGKGEEWWCGWRGKGEEVEVDEIRGGGTGG